MSGAGTEPAIEIRDLVLQYGELRAVDRLSLRVERGALFGFLGPNGAGKTSTISCVAGLTRPSSGSIHVDGVDALAEPKRAQSRIGVVPQRLALYATLSVVKNLKIFCGILGLSGKRQRERVEWALELAQLQDRGTAAVGELSGGMQRRLNLAAALLHDPPIIICDEPTTGVDPQSRNHLFETIQSLSKQGRTIIYTTHYMEEVETLCNRVAVIDHGRVIADDTLDGLLGRMTTGVKYRLTLARDERPETIADALRDAGIELTSVRPENQSLEQVFLALTGRALRDTD